MRMNVIIRYLNDSGLFQQYMNKSTAQYYCKLYIDKKISNRLQRYRYYGFKANRFYELLIFLPSCCGAFENEFY